LQLYLSEQFEGIISYLFKEVSHPFLEEKPENCNSPVQYPLRHLQSHNINTTSPVKAQLVTESWCSSTELLNPDDGGNMTLRNIRNCVASHQNRKSATPLSEPEITQQ